MKILIWNGSPRPQGKTAQMCAAFREAAEKNGHEAVVMDICRMNIKGCMACEYCHTKGNGSCVQQDDMQKIYPHVLDCDMIVLASPIYYNTFTGQIQCAINRLYAPDRPENLKKSALLLAAGDDNAFEGAVWAYNKNFVCYMKCEDMGIVTCHSKSDMDEVLGQVRAIAEKL